MLNFTLTAQARTYRRSATRSWSKPKMSCAIHNKPGISAESSRPSLTRGWAILDIGVVASHLTDALDDGIRHCVIWQAYSTLADPSLLLETASYLRASAPCDCCNGRDEFRRLDRFGKVYQKAGAQRSRAVFGASKCGEGDSRYRSAASRSKRPYPAEKFVPVYVRHANIAHEHMRSFPCNQ